MSLALEVCCYSVEEAVLAQDAGADRIELCAGRPEAGTTPSIGMLERAKSRLGIPVFPMVRPRGGDFNYGPDEFAAMMRDVEVVREIGFPGVVFGILQADKNLDVDRTKILVDLAENCQVTFHRAFDEVVDPIRSALALAEVGVARILTSGQHERAIDGAALLRDLVGLSGAPLILPGGGVRPDNALELIGLGATELHASCTPAGDSSIDPNLVKDMVAIVHSVD